MSAYSKLKGKMKNGSYIYIYIYKQNEYGLIENINKFIF